MTDVHIVGAGIHPFGRHDKTGLDQGLFAINEALADKQMQARLADLGGAPMPGTPEDFGKIIAAETEKWRKVVEFSGASVD